MTFKNLATFSRFRSSDIGCCKMDGGKLERECYRYFGRAADKGLIASVTMRRPLQKFADQEANEIIEAI